jgi:hypothetical protein
VGAGHSSWPTNPGIPAATSSTPGLTLDGVDVDGVTTVTTRTYFARADQHSLHASVSTVVVGVVGASNGSDVNAGFTFTDLVFSGTTGNIALSLDLHYQGVFVNSPGGLGWATNVVRLNAVNGTNSSGFSTNSSAAFASVLPGVDATYDQTLTHSWSSIPTNVAVTFQLRLNVTDQVGSNSSSSTDFANSLTFANPTAVFNLPPGVTVNSVEMGLVNNVVPEPSSFVLLLAGLAALAGFRKQPSGHIGTSCRRQRP